MLTFLIVCEPNESERKEKLLHTCKFSRLRRIDIHNHFLLFLSLPSHLFFCLTRTLFRGFCVCVCVSTSFFSLSRFSSAHRHTHISKSSFVFFALFSLALLIACWRRFAFFFFSCVRGPVCTFFFFSFFFFFFSFYNANIMSAARPIDSRQLHALRS